MKTEDIKLFHFIVESGNLTKASELLDLPKSNLSRRLKNLESTLQVALFHRHRRAISLSENGRQFYQRTKPLMNELESTIEAMVHESFELSGHLRLQLLPLPGISVFENIIFEFMERHPKINLEIITSADERNLIEHNIDVALRIGQRLEDSSLVARPLKTISMGYYASPEYLAKYGHPYSEEQLKQHQFIIQRMPSGKLAKQFPLANGQHFEAKGRLIVNDVALVMRACLKHQGVMCLPNHLARPEVEKGRLVHLLPETDSLADTGWLVYPSRSSLSLAARSLIDFLSTELERLTID